jgi:apolipoprotein N-acyltransferase
MRTHRAVTALSCLGTGLLLAAALPPWGWWPLAFAGLVCLDRLIADRARWSRFRRGTLVGLGLYLPSMAWLIDMTAPGYVIAVVAYAALFGAAVTIVPATAPGRWIALPGAIALTELLRWSWPFGGVPLSSLAVGQVAGPLAPVLRVGGSLLLVVVTVVVGVGLAALVARHWRAAAVAAAAVVLALAGAAVAPRASATGSEIRVAAVQGGGPQGTRARTTDEREVFERHLEASELVETPVDLVVWPEDVVDVPTLETSEEVDELADLARDLNATLVAGMVEDAGPDSFLNYSAAFDPDGEIVDTYEKVHRVPFGEYVPLRSLIEPFGGADLTSRDAVIGDGPAELVTPAGDASVAISWEIFFADRVREGVQNGAELVLNPTNGSSFTGTLVQTQQVASSRMRAIESDRWLVQVAPTGFSAIIGPDGTVHARTAVSEQAVLQDTVELRTGTTLATRFGYGPAAVLALAAMALGWLVARRAGRSSPADENGAVAGAPADAAGSTDGSHLDDEGDGTVVDEGDAHVGPEPAGRDLSAEVS